MGVEGGGAVGGQFCISSVDSQACYHYVLPFSLSPFRRYWPIARDYKGQTTNYLCALYQM